MRGTSLYCKGAAFWYENATQSQLIYWIVNSSDIGGDVFLVFIHIHCHDQYRYN